MYSMEIIGAHVVNEEGIFIGVIDSIAETANGVVITVEEMDEEDMIGEDEKPNFELHHFKPISEEEGEGEQ